MKFILYVLKIRPDEVLKHRLDEFQDVSCLCIGFREVSGFNSEVGPEIPTPRISPMPIFLSQHLNFNAIKNRVLEFRRFVLRRAYLSPQRILN